MISILKVINELKGKHILKRQISFGQALATVVGTVIGGGVFFKIGSISHETGTPSLTLFVWILAGVVSIASGLTVSEIAAALPVTGGSIKYIEYTYGKVWGFLFGWAQMLVYFPANIAALSVVFGQQFTVLFGFPTKYATLIALLLALFFNGFKFYFYQVFNQNAVSDDNSEGYSNCINCNFWPF